MAVGHFFSGAIDGQRWRLLDPLAVCAGEDEFGGPWLARLRGVECEAFIARSRALLFIADDAGIERCGRFVQTGLGLGRPALRSFKSVGTFTNVGRKTETEIEARRIANCCEFKDPS